MLQNAEDTRGIFVEFFYKAVEDKVQSRSQGRPIFKDVEYVTMRFAGDRTTVVTRPVTEKDRDRFAKSYNDFKEKNTKSVDGTPLEEWPLMTNAQVANLKYSNIYTVEQLAECSDSGLQNLGMNARKLREQARAYLAKAEDTASVSELAKENADLKERLEMLEQQMRQDKLDRVNSKPDQPEPKLPEPPVEKVKKTTSAKKPAAKKTVSASNKSKDPKDQAVLDAMEAMKALSQLIEKVEN